jgi:SulP family sulfate permease
MSEVTQTKAYLGDEMDEDDEPEDTESIRLREVPKGVVVFEINGAFFFGAADKFKSMLNTVQKKPRVLVLRMRHVLVLDATALRALEDVFHRARRDGTTVVLSGVHAQPLVVMKQSGFADLVGVDNMVSTIDQALARARAVVESQAAKHAG